MLKHLSIKNIILVESAEIEFLKGLNILSGETGSGKSAVMEALGQLTGERSDVSIVRHGSDKGVVIGSFEISHLPHVIQILADIGIDHQPDDLLVIKKEISSNGKSRAFINHQPAQLTALKKVGEELVEIVAQHATQKLFDSTQYLKIVDLYGGLNELRDAFNKGWMKETTVKNKLQQLIADEQKRLREIETCKRELEELNEAALKEGEEEELFAEYSRMTNNEQLLALSESAASLFTEISNSLNQVSRLLEELAHLDPSLAVCKNAIKNSKIEIEDASYTMTKKVSAIENDPERVHEINTRLSLINKLKKKYGPLVKDVLDYQEEKGSTLERLENCVTEIEELQKEAAKLETSNNNNAKNLTAGRTLAAKKLEQEITEHLRTLNMPKAAFFIEINSQKRTRTGDDSIEFTIAPNAGERKVPIRECASGGEISRLMLSLQTVLSGKEGVPTLVFDEIDANIGGQTATVVGEKLRHIGERHQVLCVTHFPQVAKQAHHHLCITKREEKGRTFTMIDTLDIHQKEKELARMSGIII